MKAVVNWMLALWSGWMLGCTSQHQHPVRLVDEFPVVKEIAHQPIETLVSLQAPVGVLILDRTVVVLDLNADTLFHLFEYPSFTPIGKFVRRGQAMNEEPYVDPFIQYVDGQRFLYRNLSGVKCMKYDSEKNELLVDQFIEFPDELSDLFHPIMINGQVVGVRNRQVMRKEFVTFDPESQKISDWGEEFPDVVASEKMSDSGRIQLFVKANTVKPDGTAMASVYGNFPMLRIYTSTGKVKKEVRLNTKQAFPTALLSENPSPSSVAEIVQNYRIIKSTNRYIYALYSGKKYKEISPGFNDYASTIHVWDWEGEPIMELNLDHKIFSFDVSSDDAVLIGTTFEEKNTLYSFPLPF